MVKSPSLSLSLSLSSVTRINKGNWFELFMLPYLVFFLLSLVVLEDISFIPSLSIFWSSILGKKETQSHASIIAPPENDFIDQGILSYEQIYSFDDEGIESMKANGVFSSDTIFRSFDALFSLILFLYLGYVFRNPFSLGLK